MTKALEFRSRAEHFRQLAAQFPNQEFRQIILGLATTWENLADDRERLGPSHLADHLAASKNVINDPGSEREVHNHKEDEKPNSQDVPIGLAMQQEDSAAADC